MVSLFEGTVADKEVMMTHDISKKKAKTAVWCVILGLLLSGCASQTGTTSTKKFDDNFYFVPRVHVEDNSFGVTGGGSYNNCSYDLYSEGYWCPK